MAEERFIETGKGTFYGEYIYDQAVPKEHFLRKLNHTGFAGIIPALPASTDGLARRYKVEQKFGEAKHYTGFASIIPA